MGRAEEAKKFQESEPAKAEAIYKEIVSKSPEANDAATKEYEVALVGLGETYRDSGYVRIHLCDDAAVTDNCSLEC